jgi:glutaminyl-peptide cyclotransferase
VGKPGLRIPMEAWSLRRSGPLVQVVFNRALALGLDALDPTPGPAVLDDHVPFLERGIAAMDLIDMDYPAWHTLADTPENCSAESLGQIGRLLEALISEDFARGHGLSP